MNKERRWLLAALLASPLLAHTAQDQLPPVDSSRHRGPLDQQNPPDESPKIDPRAVLKENQQKIKQDADRLFELASELKKQTNQTNSADILSLDLVRKAEEIEKLARRIKNLARG